MPEVIAEKIINEERMIRKRDLIRVNMVHLHKKCMNHAFRKIVQAVKARFKHKNIRLLYYYTRTVPAIFIYNIWLDCGIIMQLLYNSGEFCPVLLNKKSRPCDLDLP